MTQNAANRLFLIRHGENIANVTREFSCRRVDYSLTPKGVLQAQQTAGYLREKGIHEVVTSPLKRAAETAAIIAEPLGLSVVTVENFREVNVGDLEGQPPTPELWEQHNAIIRAWAGGNPDICFPGGEDCYSLTARALAGLRQVLTGKSGRNIVIAAHGGILIFALRHLFPGPQYAELWKQGMDNCAVSEVDASLNGDHLSFEMVSYNFTGHLNGEAAKLVSGVLGGTRSDR